MNKIAKIKTKKELGIIDSNPWLNPANGFSFPVDIWSKRIDIE